MKETNVNKIVVALLACIVQISPPAAAQESRDRSVEQYLCKDIMRDAGGDRDVAIAFLHGFLLGKSGASKFNLDTLKKQTDAFVEYCLDHPSDKAVDVMTQFRK